jgi:hypothetical protein
LTEQQEIAAVRIPQKGEAQSAESCDLPRARL